MREGREGVLVRVLVRVLVLVLVLVELGPQVGRGAQGGPAVSTLRRQKTRVQLLAQDVLLWKRRRGRRLRLFPGGHFLQEQDIQGAHYGGLQAGPLWRGAASQPEAAKAHSTA